MRIVIAGAGEVGSHLAKMLSNENNDITVVDSSRQRLQALHETTDVITVEGNPSSIEVLRYAGTPSADLFIAVSPASSQDVNIVSATLAKKMGCKKVTARINDEEYLTMNNMKYFGELGIDLLFYPEKIAAGEIVDLLKRTCSTDAMDFAGGKLQMTVFKLEEDSPLLDRTILDFSNSFSSGELQFRVVAISRGGKTVMPKFDTVFKYHDLVYIIAKREGIEAMMAYLGKKDMEVGSVMILGGGKIGEMVARQLSGTLERVKILDIDHDKCIGLSQRLGNKVVVVNGDGRNSDTLLEESIKDYDAFVAVTESSETNILACVAAKNMGIGRVIAEVENIEYIRLAEDMGVDAVINKKLITAGRIFKFTLSNKVRFIKYMSGTDAELLEYVVTPDSRITKAPLKDIGFPRDAVIGGVIRGNDAFIAVGDTVLAPYDRVAVFTSPESVKTVDAFFK